MKVIVIKPNTQPEITEIDNTLKAMQDTVGGYIQAIYPFSDEIALVCNEEGKLIGLPLNRPLFDCSGNLVDLIAGTFFLCYAPADSDEFQSIPDSLIDKYTELFRI